MEEMVPVWVLVYQSSTHFRRRDWNLGLSLSNYIQYCFFKNEFGLQFFKADAVLVKSR